MYKPRYVLSIDPSGNYDEGTGITGWTLLYSTSPKKIKAIKWGIIDAGTASCQGEHWQRHLDLIKGLTETLGEKPIVVIEDYLLYSGQAQSQTNSRFETPMLIGCLKLYCYVHGYVYAMQTASSVKNRWSNDVLEYKGFIELRYTQRGNTTVTSVFLNGHQIVGHIQDALRHGVHYCTFKLHKED